MIDVGQLREIEPHIEAAHAKHTASSKSPYDPIRELYVAGGSDGSLVETIAHIHAVSSAHFERLDTLGVEYRPVLAASFMVNLLTEDNLPHYTKTIDRVAQQSEIFSSWLNRWTNEEQKHSILLRDYAIYSGIIGLEDAIIPHDMYHEGVVSQLEHGTEISIQSLASGFAYLSFQEGLTKVAHRNEKALLDSTGRRVVTRVAADEAGHESFYAYLQSIMFQLYPDETLIATAQVRRSFTMPGKIGIPKFEELATRMAIAGLFMPATVQQVQNEHLHGESWNIASLQPTNPEAEKAQAYLLSENKVLIRLQQSFEKKQDAAIQLAKENGTLLPFILGKTVDVDEHTKELVAIAA